jgi:ABC-type branched-subunit amino acid transport system substrate-binding protein
MFKTNTVKHIGKDKGVSIYTESVLATDTDTSTSLFKLKQKGVDSILVVAYDKQTLQIVSKIKDLKLGVNIYNAWMWGDKDFETNSKILDGVFDPRSVYLFGSNEKAVKFNQEFKTKFGSEGNQFAAIGCDLSILIGENNIKTAEDMKNLKSFNGINGEIKQEAYGELDFPVKMVQYKDKVVNILK